ncbi:hypothetical protein GCM10009609_42900 [Pseudonocardia aurantiaca]|uniref:Uncharacterized protein n=1 Tax=Pseudonocardia aurantiaca TaxID=75290 RepID=A0ABW4FX56_9PSEU
MTVYVRIGRSYRTTRRPDPRIATQVAAVLAGMTSVVNVGAGTGFLRTRRDGRGGRAQFDHDRATP